VRPSYSGGSYATRCMLLVRVIAVYFGCAFHIMICRFLDLSNTSLTAPGPARMRGGGAPQARTFGVSRIVSYQLLPSERALERDQGPSAEEGGKASRLGDGHLAKLILNLIKACLGSSILVSSALACCARLEWHMYAPHRFRTCMS